MYRYAIKYHIASVEIQQNDYFLYKYAKAPSLFLNASYIPIGRNKLKTSFHKIKVKIFPLPLSFPSSHEYIIYIG